VIPDSVVLRGTTRSFSRPCAMPSTGDPRVAEGVCAALGAV